MGCEGKGSAPVGYDFGALGPDSVFISFGLRALSPDSI